MKYMRMNLRAELDKHADVRKLVRARINKMLTKEHLAAFLLSPTHRKGVLSESACNLSPTEKEEAIDYIQSKCPALLPKVFKFGDHKPPFNKPAFCDISMLNSMTDYDWWSAFTDTFPDVLSDDENAFVLKLSTAVASSADLERMFSKFGLIQSKLRNRLGTQLASKLVFLYNKLNKTD